MSVRSLYRSKKGMVSIMTTMIMIIVISLIVVGFAQISRRNQREGLDRQLSTQAFYAAESGINDAQKLLSDAVLAGTIVPNKTSCTDTGGGFYSTLASAIDPATNTSYSCLIVDTTPTEVTFSSLGTDSVVLPILPEGGAVLSSLEFTLNSSVSNPQLGCPTTLNQTFSTHGSSWTCGYGALRIDLLRVDGTFTAADLYTRNMTVFAVPFPSGTPGAVSSVPYAQSSSNNSPKVGMSCTSGNCTFTITGLSSNAFYVRLSSLYRDVSLKVRARSGATLVGLQNVQATIDATGRAQDVLRRIKVNVPLRASNQNQLPDYAIQSTDALCKRFAVMDGYYDSQVTGVTSTNRLCQP